MLRNFILLNRVRVKPRISQPQAEIIFFPYHSFPSIHLTQRLKKASRGFVIPVPLHHLPLGVRHPCKAEKAISFNVTKRKDNYLNLSTRPKYGLIMIVKTGIQRIFSLNSHSVMERCRKCGISVQFNFSKHCYVCQGREVR